MKKNRNNIATQSVTGIVNCACVIHGTKYDWSYVEKLYNMVKRNLSFPMQFHVYTEPDRSVPDFMTKHCLEDWGLRGSKRAWWYKMQLFNKNHHSGPLLYFDLDTVITRNIDWIVQLPTEKFFWGVRDFKYLWRPAWYGTNSSVMWWNTTVFDHVWNNFEKKDIASTIKRYHGDQDYITDNIIDQTRRHFDTARIKSWRWECLHGGYNFKSRVHKTPGSGTCVPDNTSILVFHGDPKPHTAQDKLIQQYWQ